MINVQEFIGTTNLFKKFEVDELLFVEVICPADEGLPSNLWWHNNFFSYAFAGEMLLKTLRGEHIFKAGDCIFSKKGSIISATHLIHADFCELRVFVPDNFIKYVFQKYQMPRLQAEPNETTDTLIPLTSDEVLEVYFQSLLTYFRQPAPPPATLLKLKFEELVVNILSNNKHTTLQRYLSELCNSSRPALKEIMEANFFSNLSLDEFARLCGRSLSAFKREFIDTYHTTPGKWLQDKRLEYSRYLMETTDQSIDEICMLSGFENKSHFIRVFKNKFALTPGKFKVHGKTS